MVYSGPWAMDHRLSTMDYRLSAGVAARGCNRRHLARHQVQDLVLIPQREQNARWFCGDDSNSAMASLPVVMRKSPASTDAAATKAEPDVRRHCEQWQHVIGPIAPWTSKRTAPQRHPPVCMGVASSGKDVVGGV